MYKFVVFAILAAAAVSAMPSKDSTQETDCFKTDDMISCFAVKAITRMRRAANDPEVSLATGVKLVRDNLVSAEREGRAMDSETELMNQLPEESVARTLKVINMVYESALNFFKSHSLKLDLSDNVMSRALEEGRFKKNPLALKGILAAAGVKYGLMAFGLIGLTVLVIKALIIGKLALLVAGVMAFQRLFGSGIGLSSLFGKQAAQTATYPDSVVQTWSSSPQTQQGYYKRSFEDDAHNLAYSAHAPNAQQTQ